jgi:hypothetical protein
MGAAPPRIRVRRSLLSTAIVVFCLIEQINLRPSNLLSRSRELAWLSEVPAPPSQCQAFLLKIANQPDVGDEIDAMWISLLTDLPTLNGYSGWSPPGWHLDDPTIDYYRAVREWISQTRLSGQVCTYDRSARTWAKFD